MTFFFRNYLSSTDSLGLLAFLKSGINREQGMYFRVCFRWGMLGAVTSLPSECAAVRLHSALR